MKVELTSVDDKDQIIIKGENNMINKLKQNINILEKDMEILSSVLNDMNDLAKKSHENIIDLQIAYLNLEKGKGKEMKIINLTPHEINIEGQKAILSSGIARCKEIINIVDNFDGIDIIEKKFGEVYDLPAPEENTIYIVSIIVASALKGKRNDVYIPGEIIRNDIGQIIGCKNIARL